MGCGGVRCERVSQRIRLSCALVYLPEQSRRGCPGLFACSRRVDVWLGRCGSKGQERGKGAEPRGCWCGWGGLLGLAGPGGGRWGGCLPAPAPPALPDCGCWPPGYEPILSLPLVVCLSVRLAVIGRIEASPISFFCPSAASPSPASPLHPTCHSVRWKVDIPHPHQIKIKIKTAVQTTPAIATAAHPSFVLSPLKAACGPKAHHVCTQTHNIEQTSPALTAA